MPVFHRHVPINPSMNLLLLGFVAMTVSGLQGCNSDLGQKTSTPTSSGTSANSNPTSSLSLPPASNPPRLTPNSKPGLTAPGQINPNSKPGLTAPGQITPNSQPGLTAPGQVAAGSQVPNRPQFGPALPGTVQKPPVGGPGNLPQGITPPPPTISAQELARIAKASAAARNPQNPAPISQSARPSLPSAPLPNLAPGRPSGRSAPIPPPASSPTISSSAASNLTPEAQLLGQPTSSASRPSTASPSARRPQFSPTIPSGTGGFNESNASDSLSSSRQSNPSGLSTTQYVYDPSTGAYRESN